MCLKIVYPSDIKIYNGIITKAVLLELREHFKI